MRTALHGVTNELPPPMPDAMTREELWQAVEIQSRLMTEALRRNMPHDLRESLELGRAVTLAMYCTVDAAA